ncbi:MAG: LysR family transcriptional regulator [Negativicutes bacterium]|nr:LysR family transcriptional regulator [Negativicutes bacterium]
MDVKDMQHFLAVVEEGSINAAAKRLHMAQPPLSRQMKQLEERLGVKLFERGKSKVRLTEAGRLLQQRAEQFLGQVDQTVKEMKAIHAGTQGTLSIGTVTSSGATILPGVVRVFRQSFPGISFQLWEGETDRITELLNRGSIEIGMVRFPFDAGIYEAIKLPNEPLVAAINKNHGDHLGQHPDQIRLSELAGKPLLIHRKYEGLIVEHCEQSGFTPEFVCMSDDVMPILAWADADIGIAIVPRAAIGLIPSTNLTYKTIDPLLETTGAVIWMKNRFLSAAARNFLTLFTQYTQKF